jgi:rRNA maturation RNase YbeY
VHIQNRQRRRKIDRPRLARLITRVLDGEGIPAERDVTLVLLRDGPVAELNARYRRREGPTDVLSFPSDPRGWPPGEPRPLGEVVISIDRACAQATERGATLGAELARLAVHGVLHLAGFRDDSAAARARMRRREDRYLRRRAERG